MSEIIRYSCAEGVEWGMEEDSLGAFVKYHPALDELLLASEVADDTNGTSDYQQSLVAIALIARHYLRTIIGG